MVKIALVDDHTLFREALASTIDGFGNCRVTVRASNGQDLIENIKKDNLPDLILLDLNMPVMDGYKTAGWLKKTLPNIHTLALTMVDSDLAMIRLIRLGVRGFLKKDILPLDLKRAIEVTMETGYYYDGATLARYLKNIDSPNLYLNNISLTEVEMAFLQLACSEKTYKEIAKEMGVSPRTVDGYRESLFGKLDVKTRIGIVLFSIRHGLTQVEFK